MLSDVDAVVPNSFVTAMFGMPEFIRDYVIYHTLPYLSLNVLIQGF
jgi:hypothetical protein